MLKVSIFTLSLLVVSTSQAGCLPDAYEIGDIGPGSDRICNMLEAQLPHSDIVIVDRKILSKNDISVTLVVDGKIDSLKYKLSGADWKLARPNIAQRY